jgi:uncharacterized protein (TIGR02172 family)
VYSANTRDSPAMRGIVAAHSMSSTFAQFQKAKLIGKGLTSEVFTWSEDRVLKLALPGRPHDKVQREFEITRTAHAAGLPAPAAFELIEVHGRFGIVLQRLHGPSLLKQVEVKPWTLFTAARQLAELHTRLHSCPAPPRLPSQQGQLASFIERAKLSDSEREQALQCLADLPPGDCVCHGDFHPANIILTAGGPIFIDWSRATCGHALADVARTSVLFETAELPNDSPFHTRLLMKFARGALHSTYLKHYLAVRGGSHEEIEKWRPLQRIVAAAWWVQRR